MCADHGDSRSQRASLARPDAESEDPPRGV